MIRYGNLYGKIVDFENIYNAYYRARKAKRYKDSTLEFSRDLESGLISVKRDLDNKTYRVGPYKSFYVYEPKKREIFALAFRDRVVQHALISVIEPILGRSFIFDTYACQINKGTHAGLRRLHRSIAGQNPNGYFLKADISKYFPSIRKDVLKQKIRKRIKCRDTLWLIDLIIDSSKAGLPIGNLTSQLFANYYLSDLDHFIKERLMENHYVRYMDDFIIINKDLARLKRDLYYIEKELRYIGLTLNSKTSIGKIKQGIDFLGYRSWPHITKLRKRNIRRNRRKFRKMAGRLSAGMTNKTILLRSAASFNGYTKYAACATSRDSILRPIQRLIKIGA